MKRYALIPALLIVSGLLFILIGIYQGEVRVIFMKAVKICLECIGIG